ncbi:hypothetical protein G4V39_10095 [Thermosulfuriphilus ammonigenes]|uniref:Uncharacterized protein n=1 Tax=Thermosulfuriphilus ammonigenes TaxID=1936021 RepID=A0A6G7PY65_9BACT|nr:hypothetical protein [Thermosulfuriphilus ammonigenes]MBA2849853.1 hypothetical protein [Thermosulfuriphilus ammonigenes]QIJ72602.1 hypothetical protein G4V39_10095 [Thermosulfuriphilus ammonigenes]
MTRCKLCFSFFENVNYNGVVCPRCGLLHGQDWKIVIEKIKAASQTIKFSNYNTPIVRIGLKKPKGNPRWGGYNFNPTCFEILLNSHKYVVTDYPFRAPLLHKKSYLWRYRSTIEYKIKKINNEEIDAYPSLCVGVICRPNDITSLIEIGKMVQEYVREYVIVIDSFKINGISVASIKQKIHDVLSRNSPNKLLIKIADRPLGQDFSAQRNFLHSVANSNWILHIDTDERPSRQLMKNLYWIIEDCQKKGRDTAGFPRKNFVDGKLSAAFPDYQFRLVKKETRWVGKVHEVPVSYLKNYHKTLIYPLYCINHYLESSRLSFRRKFYESIQDGAGRTKNQELLEKPFFEVVGLSTHLCKFLQSLSSNKPKAV